jgi:hypothetical protein
MLNDLIFGFAFGLFVGALIHAVMFKPVWLLRIKQARANALKQAAAICDDIESEKWARYVGYRGFIANADPKTMGESFGAAECAEKIRELGANQC